MVVGQPESNTHARLCLHITASTTAKCITEKPSPYFELVIPALLHKCGITIFEVTSTQGDVCWRGGKWEATYVDIFMFRLLMTCVRRLYVVTNKIIKLFDKSSTNSESRGRVREQASSINNVQTYPWTHKFSTRKALDSLIMKITAKENDTNDILQTFRQLLLSLSVH